MSIMITTPTGNVGSRALRRLLNAGADVSVIVRQPEKLDESIRSRVKIHQGSLTDAGFVKKAFRDAQAVLWITPTNLMHPDVAAHHSELGAIASAAIKENKVPYTVNISSAGAQLPNAGPVSGVGVVERLLDDVAQNIIHLRPGFFMENFLADLESIKANGAIHYPFPADTPFPMIAAQDIGGAAAEFLLKTGWSGRSVRGLHGPEDLTFADAAKTLSDSLDIPVEHVEITSEQAYENYLRFGISPGYARAFVEMYRALSQPKAVAEARTPLTTTPTTLREWSDAVLRPIFTG